MISLNNVSFGYGGQVIFEKATHTFNPGCKAGLIGPNGAGKSTLFRLLIGEQKPDQGEVSALKNLQIEHFHQDLLSINTHESILSIVLTAFKEVLEIQEKINTLLEEIENDHSEKKIEQLGDLQNRLENLDGYSVQSRSEEILVGLGFSEDDFHRPLSEFSGGWRMRVLLGKILLSKPDLLLLDEPSNHLDLPSIEWLEEYLQSYPGGFVLISHDKRFLNSSVNEIVEIRNQNLKGYVGNFDAYLIEKEVQDEIAGNAFKNQQKMIKDTERFINRFRAKASKARQVQSRVKHLEKIDRLDIPEENRKEIKIDFPINRNPGKVVAEGITLSKSYPEIEIFRNTEFLIKRGDKVALIGANGKGKSTLLKILAKKEPFEGKLSYGHNLDLQYYAQHQLEELNLSNSVLKEAQDGISNKNEKEVRDVLGVFLFSGEEAEKKVKVLSGGEKARLALAKIFLREPNFILLDEPTNHLDMVSIEILKEALRSYPGTLIVVSHNRDFIAGIANKIWWINERELKEYPGNYDEYSYSVKQKSEAPKKNQSKDKKVKVKRPQKPERKTLGKELENKIQKVENGIEAVSKKIKEVEDELVRYSQEYNEEKMNQYKKEYEELKEIQDDLYREWENLANEL